MTHNNHKAAMEAMLADYGRQPEWHRLSINPAWLAEVLKMCDKADEMGCRINPEYLVAPVEFGTSHDHAPTAKYILHRV